VLFVGDPAIARPQTAPPWTIEQALPVDWGAVWMFALTVSEVVAFVAFMAAFWSL
jgi:hypothetical protein